MFFYGTLAYPIIAAGILQPQGEAVAGDVRVESDGRTVMFGNALVAMALDAESGALRAVMDRTAGAAVAESRSGAFGLDWLVESEWHSAQDSGEGPSAQLLQYHAAAEDGAGALRVTTNWRGWLVTQQYRAWPGKPWIERSVTLTPAEGSEGYVRAVRFEMQGLAVQPAESCEYSILSNYPPTNVPFTSLIPGRQVGEATAWQTSRFVMVTNAAANRAVLCAFYCETENAGTTVREGTGWVDVLHDQHVVAAVEAGRPQRFGRQFIAVLPGTESEALAAAQDMYRLVGLDGPPQSSKHLADRAVIYSAHPGGTIDSGFQDVGGCEQLSRSFPHLADMGINVLWLLPFWHGHIYAPIDYYRLDSRYATDDDLRLLVERAHANGIRVLLDLIPHGPLDSSGLHLEHPDWICKNPDGSFQYWWGCLYADYAHPGWQSYMGEHAAYWVRTAGVDGYRVDCAGGGPPNWRPYGDNRPSMSGLHGGLGVLQAARERMEETKPDPLLIAESSGPAFYRVADLTYDWQMVFHVLPQILGAKPEELVPSLRVWLQRQMLTFPPDANLMRFLENHDTSRAQMRYGVDLQRALMALFAVAKGSPLVYHEQEVGYTSFLARLYRYRAAHDEMTAGKADYLAVTCSEAAALPVLRSLDDRHTIALVSFSHRPVQATLGIPAAVLGRDGAAYLFDEFGGRLLRHRDGPLFRAEHLAGVEVALEPFGVALLRVIPESEGPPAMPPPVPEPAPVRGHPPTALETPEGLVIENGIYRLTIGRENGGLIRELRSVPTGRVLLGASRLSDEGNKLFLGTDIRLGPENVESLTFSVGDGNLVARATGTIHRETTGGVQQAVLAYEAVYETSDGPEIVVRWRLTPLVRTERVLGALVQTFDLGSPKEWFVNTAEGLLFDDYIVRHARDVQYRSRYVHGHGSRLWWSSLLPLHLEAPMLGARYDRGQYVALTGLTVPPEGSVWLKERDGEREALTAEVAWLDGSHAVTLVPGERGIGGGYTIRIGTATEQEIRRTAYPPESQSSPRVYADGAAYVVENDYYELRAVRGRGGAIAGLISKLTSGNMIDGGMVYTDYGLYPHSVDPSGNRQVTQATSSVDPECEVTVEREGTSVRLTFEGRLRNATWDGMNAMRPPTRYRLTYEADGSPRVRVTCAVRAEMALRGARAFLAQTLTVPAVTSWAATSADGVDTEPRPGERAWQSSVEGLAEQPAIVACDASTGTYVTLCNLDWSPRDKPLQNLFLLLGSPSGTVFLAFMDGQPADVNPEWRTVSYDLIVGAGTVGDGLAAAGVTSR